MKTKSPGTSAALDRRIKQLYKLLNQRDFKRCYGLIDPHIRHRATSVTLDQYANSLAEFLAHFGSVKVLDISLDLHLGEPSALYEGRDFALGKTIWQDETGHQHTFSERWVRDEKSWFTRSTGFITPATVAPRRKRA